MPCGLSSWSRLPPCWRAAVDRTLPIRRSGKAAAAPLKTARRDPAEREQAMAARAEPPTGARRPTAREDRAARAGRAAWEDWVERAAAPPDLRREEPVDRPTAGPVAAR